MIYGLQYCYTGKFITPEDHCVWCWIKFTKVPKELKEKFKMRIPHGVQDNGMYIIVLFLPSPSIVDCHTS